MLSQIDANQKEAIGFLQDLVKIPTFVPPGNNYDKVAEIVAEKMKEAGCAVQLAEASSDYMEKAGATQFRPPLEGARVNTIGRIAGQTGSPTLVFNGHIDTVPVNPGWKVDAFSGEIIGDAIYGRGVSDNKGGVCAMVMAFKALKDAGVKLKGNAVLTATADEEVGGIAGLGYIVDAGLVKGDYGICVDGGIENIGISCQGRIKYNIHTLGKAAHSSTPQLGINAIEHMAKVVLALQSYGRELLKRESSIPAPPDIGAKRIYPSTAVGIIRGGTKENIIPSECTITLNRRFTPDENIEDVRKEIRETVEGSLKDDPQARWKIDEVNVKDAYAIAANHPIVGILNSAAEEILGQKLPIYGSTGGTDMSHIKRANIPMCALGPSRRGNNVHAPDEHLPISDLMSLTKIYALAALKILL